MTKSWFGVTASLKVSQQNLAWKGELRVIIPAHAIRFRLQALNPVSVYVVFDDGNLIF